MEANEQFPVDSLQLVGLVGIETKIGFGSRQWLSAGRIFFLLTFGVKDVFGVQEKRRPFHNGFCILWVRVACEDLCFDLRN